MQNNNRIYITGCARSGTTLLNRLFYSFQDVEIIDCEIDLNQFINVDKLKSNLVAKRSPFSVFSMPINDTLFFEQLQIIKSENIKILNIIRDGRDVVHRDKVGSPDVNLKRWIGCMKSVIKYSELINLNIKYENLVKKPNNIQNLIAKKFNLKINNKFSD